MNCVRNLEIKHVCGACNIVSYIGTRKKMDSFCGLDSSTRLWDKIGDQQRRDNIYHRLPPLSKEEREGWATINTSSPFKVGGLGGERN